MRLVPRAFALALVLATLGCGRDAPLHEAVEARDLSRVVALLSSGADLESRNVDGRTALAVAAALGETAIVRVLLDAGADPGRGDDPLSARVQAEVTGASGAFELLVDHEALARGEAVHVEARPEPSSEAWARRVLGDLGHDPGGTAESLHEAIRSFEEKHVLVKDGKLDREVRLHLWVLDPIAALKTSMVAEDCAVCMGRLWNRTMARGTLSSPGGCEGVPLDALLEHATQRRYAIEDAGPDGAVEVVTRHGSGCLALTQY